MRVFALVLALSFAAIAGSSHEQCPRKSADCPRHGDTTALTDSTARMDSVQCKKKGCCKKSKSPGECPRMKNHSHGKDS